MEICLEHCNFDGVFFYVTGTWLLKKKIFAIQFNFCTNNNFTSSN